MGSTVAHLLVDVDGNVFRHGAFAPGVRWLPGDTVHFGGDESYLVLERRRDDEEPVVLVVERR